MAETSATRAPDAAEQRPADGSDTGEPALPPGPGPAVAEGVRQDEAAGAPAVAPEIAAARAERLGRAEDPRGPAPVRTGARSVTERVTSPEEMRREIEATRARMSRTLDQIEDRVVHEKEELVRKKEELWARATLRDFRRTVSREPWRSVALAAVAGYLVAAVRD